jgi:hypothetical protein
VGKASTHVYHCFQLSTLRTHFANSTEIFIPEWMPGRRMTLHHQKTIQLASMLLVFVLDSFLSMNFKKEHWFQCLTYTDVIKKWQQWQEYLKFCLSTSTHALNLYITFTNYILINIQYIPSSWIIL